MENLSIFNFKKQIIIHLYCTIDYITLKRKQKKWIQTIGSNSKIQNAVIEIKCWH